MSDLSNMGQAPEREPRAMCYRCFQPAIACYCADLSPFDPDIEFVILIHPIEVRRRIATGRMSHLSLQGSHFFEGEDFSNHVRLNAILQDRTRQVVILYPGPTAIDIERRTKTEWVKSEQRLVVVVIDGTWATAKKMVRSRNLIDLQRIAFRPSTPSRFRVRKQPHPECFSTIEAIHRTIEILGDGRGPRRHDALLHVFDRMVERQLIYMEMR